MAITPKSEYSSCYPFFDPLRAGQELCWGTRIGIALGVGALYLLIQYYSLPNKIVFFQQYCWILGIIISTSVLALYVATEVFRRNLQTMQLLEVDQNVSHRIITKWLRNKNYLLAGAGFATVNTTVGHLLGVPADFHVNVLALTAIYLGMFSAGFAAGMGLLGIVAIIVLYLNFAPVLQHSLDPTSPDGIGGFKKLGDSLWFFGSLIGVVGVLVSIYMFGVQWNFAYKEYVQIIFLCWVSLPYILAVSIVLIPGLAVRRQVGYYKAYKEEQLKREKAKLYSSYKKFDALEDDAIINEKKVLSERLNRIQEELEQLKKMRNSHIDGSD